MKAKKINRYAAKAIALRDSGKSVEQVVAWYQRMTCSTAEVKNGIVTFWFPEQVETGYRTYHFTMRSTVILELPTW